MKKIIIAVMVLLQWRLNFFDCLQIFLEDVGLYTAYCPPPSLSNSKEVEVYLIKNNKDLIRYICNDLTKPCQGLGGYNATFNTSGSYFPLENRGISDMRQLNGIKCLFKNNDYSYIDSIYVVAKPQNINCDVPTLSNDKKDMSLTCRTSKVYPQAVCTFDIQNKIAGTLNYSHVNYTQVFEYYNTSCTWTSPLSNFEVGQYQYTVSLFPSGTSNTINYGASLTQSFPLTLPPLSLAKECFNGPNIVNGYIKPGATVNCFCYIESIGFPTPFVSWMNVNGQEDGTSVNSTAISLTISPASDLQTFSCILSTNLKDGNKSLNYTVNYAKIPSACNVELKDPTQTIWSICNTETFVNLSIVCSVNKSDVKPGIKSIIYINSISSGVLDSELSENLFRSTYEATLTQAGIYTINCQVKNTLFDDLTTTCTYSKVIQLRAPPESAPILQITSTTKQNVEGKMQENEVYEVECIVLGGIPLVNTVTVSCGNITESTQSGNILKSHVTFTRNMTGQNCTCTAQHITGCYTRNVVGKQLNILYNEYSPENVNVGAAVGGTLAALVVIVIIVVIIVFLIRKKPNLLKRNKEAKRQHNPMYSELSVSQSIHDRHTYETPIINTNISPLDKEEKRNASYCNNTVNDVNCDYFNGNSSPYCNTNEFNQDLFKVNYIVPEDKEKEETPYVEVE